jgi:hypothetical protein
MIRANDSSAELKWMKYGLANGPKGLAQALCHGSKLNQPANGRNDPASGARIRPHEKRGIFLSNKPDIKELMRACLEENADLRRFSWLGHFDPLAGL